MPFLQRPFSIFFKAQDLTELRCHEVSVKILCKMTILNKSISQGQNLNFEQVFPLLAEDVLDIVKKLNFPENAIEYLSRMMFHNVPGGKMNRGLSVFHSFQLLNPNYSPHMKFKADILGWCVEWLQAFFLVADDIMDHSKTRRGQPCWYLVENVGNIAINDSFLLESFIYQILKKYFRQEEFYVDLLELFHEVTFQTELGQLMDLLTAPENDVDLNRFSAQKYTLPIFSGC